MFDHEPGACFDIKITSYQYRNPRHRSQTILSLYSSAKLTEKILFTLKQTPGSCLDIKMSYQYRNSHYKDITISWMFYIFNANPYTWKDGLYIETGPLWSLGLLLTWVDHFYWTRQHQVSMATLIVWNMEWTHKLLSLKSQPGRQLCSSGYYITRENRLFIYFIHRTPNPQWLYTIWNKYCLSC